MEHWEEVGGDWGGAITSYLKGPHAYLHRGEGAY